jgi:hypothetical protein
VKKPAEWSFVSGHEFTRAANAYSSTSGFTGCEKTLSKGAKCQGTTSVVPITPQNGAGLYPLLLLLRSKPLFYQAAYSVHKNPAEGREVSGHDFSRADKDNKNAGF